MDELSTWYLRLSRERMRRNDDADDRVAAFATLHEALVATAGCSRPILPFLSETMYGNLVGRGRGRAGQRPPDRVADGRAGGLPRRAAGGRDGGRAGRGRPGADAPQFGADQDPSAARRGRGWRCRIAALDVDDELLSIIADEINVKDVEVIADDSDLVERRVKPLLPKIGKRLGPQIPAVMAAARDGAVTYESDGSVTLGGVTLAPDEVEIQATPRPGTAVADHDGLVVVIDTDLTPALRAEGDARELQRAVQDLRQDAGLELDDRIDLWVDGLAGRRRGVPARGRRRDPGRDLTDGAAPVDASRATVELDVGPVAVALRRRPGGG